MWLYCFLVTYQTNSTKFFHCYMDYLNKKVNFIVSIYAHPCGRMLGGT